MVENSKQENALSHKLLFGGLKMNNPFISKRRVLNLLLSLNLTPASNVLLLLSVASQMSLPQKAWDEFMDGLLERLDREEIYTYASTFACYATCVSPTVQNHIRSALIQRGAVRALCTLNEKTQRGISIEELCLLTAMVIANNRKEELNTLLSEIQVHSIRNMDVAVQLGELLNPVFAKGKAKLPVVAQIGVVMSG